MEERDVLIATTLAQTRTNFDRLYSRHARHYGMRRQLCLNCLNCLFLPQPPLGEPALYRV
jgi:hypothetical protein